MQGKPSPLAYDSSDKRRVPAYTDRIFFRGSGPARNQVDHIGPDAALQAGCDKACQPCVTDAAGPHTPSCVGATYPSIIYRSWWPVCRLPCQVSGTPAQKSWRAVTDGPGAQDEPEAQQPPDLDLLSLDDHPEPAPVLSLLWSGVLGCRQEKLQTGA